MALPMTRPEASRTSRDGRQEQLRGKTDSAGRTMPPVSGDRTQDNQTRQFDKLTASELYCPKCKKLQPVRERLLLVLPQGELFEYRCVVCGESLGSREVKEPARQIVCS